MKNNRPVKNASSGKKVSIYQIVINIKNPTGPLVQEAEEGKPSETLSINATPLTIDILNPPPDVNKSGLSKYPFMIEHRRFPSDALFSVLITGYGDIIKFFFDKKFFISTIGPTDVYTSEVAHLSGQERSNAVSEILDYNVKLMLALLFPTTYPVPRNNFNSYGHYITSNDSTVFVKGQIQSKLLGQPLYTYIQLGGSKYTVTRTVWLNDVYNNPVYRVLINDYNEFVEWMSESKPKVIKEIRGLILSILKSNAFKVLFAGNDVKCPTDAEFDKIIKATGAKFTDISNSKDCTIVFLSQIYQEYIRVVKKTSNLDLRYQAPLFQMVEDLKNIYEYIKILNKFYISSKDDENIEKLMAFYTDDRIEETEANEDIGTAFLYDTSIKYFLDNLFLLKKTYDNSLKSGTERTIDYSAEVVELMNLLKNVLAKITLAKKVYTNYLIPKKYIIEETDDGIKSELQSKYETLVNYGKRVQNMKKNISTNGRLQRAVNAYINAEQESEFEALLDSIQSAIMSNKLIKDVVYDKELLNTGVGRINPNDKEKPQYEIYIGMDLIKGELKQEDVDKIKCAYEGYFLGQQLSMWSIAANDIDYIVVDLDDLMKRSKPAEPTQPVKTGGSKRLTRRQYFAFTRKSRKRI